jgi:hypothetical protein
MSRSGQFIQFVQEMIDNNADDMYIINETTVRFGVRITTDYIDSLREHASLDSTYDNWG